MKGGPRLRRIDNKNEDIASLGLTLMRAMDLHKRTTTMEVIYSYPSPSNLGFPEFMIMT